MLSQINVLDSIIHVCEPYAVLCTVVDVEMRGNVSMSVYTILHALCSGHMTSSNTYLKCQFKKHLYVFLYMHNHREVALVADKLKWQCGYETLILVIV